MVEERYTLLRTVNFLAPVGRTNFSGLAPLGAGAVGEAFEYCNVCITDEGAARRLIHIFKKQGGKLNGNKSWY